MLTSLLPLLELAVNIALSLLGSNGVIPANYANLATQLEAVVGNLITAIKSNTAKSADVLASFDAMIGVLTALQSNTALPADVLARIAEYIAAAKDAELGYLKAESGYDPANYALI